MQTQTSRNSSWRDVLASPPPSAHILQLYDSDAFLINAVAYYAAEGLNRGEAVLLTGTPVHLEAIRRRISLLGVDADAAEHAGQLLPAGLHAVIEMVRRRAPFDIVERALADSRFTGVRWWAEVTSTLHRQGETELGLEAEHMGDTLAKQRGVRILCPHQCDKYDPTHYDAMLKDLCCIHSDLIPADNYVEHRLAVNRAVADVMGELRGSLLQSLASWQGMRCNGPSSQMLLFWLRETLPEHFDAVLRRAREYGLQENPS